MRIAMIGCKGIPAAGGGVEAVVEQLSAELSARGHDVLVYARAGYLRARPDAPPPPGRVITTAGLAGKHADTLTHTATAMWDLLRRKVDVVHVHSPGPALLSFVPAAAGVPVVFTVHGPDWAQRRWSAPGRWALRAGLRTGLRLSAVVTAVSLSMARSLADTYHTEVSHIPNGVRVVRPRPARAIAGWGLRPDGYALYVGRIVPGKDVDLLVGAWATLARRMPLVIVGDASQEPRYAAACRRAADKTVRFVGARFGEVLEELYSNAAIVVLPSRAEGMSMVLLEAAARGRCVVARDLPAHREALGQAMVGFRGDSTEALARVMVKCLDDPELRRGLGHAAGRRVADAFAWPGIAARYERSYRWALGRGRRAC